MAAFPYNTARGAASSLQMSPPFAFSDVTMSVFPLRASLPRLETFCNSYLNQAPHLVQFKPFIPFVYLVILDYGRMSLQAANMGWVSQREVAFGIPLRWLNMTPDGPEFHDWAFTSPFIFVDNEMSMSTGREVYGWPKLLAQLDPSVSEWVRDPHGARRVFQVSTKRAAHAYQGEVQQYRPFLSVYQHRAAGLFDIPPSLDTITKPLQQLSSTTAGVARLTKDLATTFAGMASDGITGSPVLPNFSDQDTFRENLQPDRLKSWANPKDWMSGIRDTLWSLFPRTYANTINFKQFRDAGDPHATCYQAITSAKMPVKSFARGGLLGPQNMMLGQLDGGFRVDVHSLAGLPIVESLGLEVAEEREADGTIVASLTPVCPLWMQVDMTYGLAETLVWQGSKDKWAMGPFLHQLAEKRTAEAKAKAAEASAKAAAANAKEATPSAPAPEGTKAAEAMLEHAKPTPPEGKPQDLGDLEDAFDLDYIRTMNFFNTARGASEAIGGSFSMPNASVRVLPIKADHAALNSFVSNYLNVKNHMRFEAWGDFVYLIICDFDQMNSSLNAMAKRRAREINFAVPVKAYDWFEDDKYADEDETDPKVIAKKAKRHLMTTGFVSAFSYVDDIGTAITASEVSGIPTMSSKIESAENDWLSLDLSKDRAERDILEMRASVLPALMSGAQAQERSVLELHSHTPTHTGVQENQYQSVTSWVSLLAEDIQAKEKQREHQPLELGQGFVLQLLGGDLPINQFSLKQFRDSRHTVNACYQGLVQRRHRLKKLADLRELEEQLHVTITDYPTQPICEILGLKHKFEYEQDGRAVRVFEPLRPFSLTADLSREAGNTLFERVKSHVWQRGDVVEQLFGWRTSDTARAEEVIECADKFCADRPVELNYVCKLRNRPRAFRLHSRKVSAQFLKDGFRKHLEDGDVSSLAIRDRYETGKLFVTTDRKLLKAVSKGKTLNIAAFNERVAHAGQMQEYSQSEAAADIATLDPATIADSVLSRQWGLAPGTNRRKYRKTDFCVRAETVPNKFIEDLFPTPERLHGYWPMTRMFFKSEVARRTADLLSFRSELFTFISGVGAFINKKVEDAGSDDYAATQIKNMIADMRHTLTDLEQPVFEKALKELQKHTEDEGTRLPKLFNAYADTLLPGALQVGTDFTQHGLLMRAIHASDILKSADWARVEEAIPRLMAVSSDVFRDDPEYVEGLQEIAEAFSERALSHREDMAALEAAIGQRGSIENYTLPNPAKILNKRLSKLVTGGIIRG